MLVYAGYIRAGGDASLESARVSLLRARATRFILRPSTEIAVPIGDRGLYAGFPQL